MKRIYSGRDFEKLLKDNNYQRSRQRGSHIIFSNGNKTLSINLRNPNRMVVERLIKEYELVV
ncbi:type II toxin-antitoxin system HicA family toxin [Butyrivibrio sp. MB2005]|uniref:type II toxin-antitoxin system HicA family toxin n=1 Tax=Butyrivibrio sp. MB2005 TaxID=1280678 RepID=UPI00047B49C7